MSRKNPTLEECEEEDNKVAFWAKVKAKLYGPLPENVNIDQIALLLKLRSEFKYRNMLEAQILLDRLG